MKGVAPIPREEDPRYFRRRGVWYTSQSGTCTGCGCQHTGAVIQGDPCSNCKGAIGPTTSIANASLNP